MTAIKAGAISFGAGLLIFLILVATVWKDSFFDVKTDETTTAEASTAAEKVEVPKFSDIGTFPVISTSALWSDRFKFVEEEVYDSKIAVGEIISQSIAAGTMVDKGTEIVLKVSKGKEMVDLPAAIIGMNYDTANTLLTGLGFVCEKQVDPNDGTKVANQVSAVSPTVNQKYEKGTKIVLKVWAEASTTTTKAATTTKPATTAATTAATTTEPSTAP